MSIFAHGLHLPQDVGFAKNVEIIRNPYCTVSDVERVLHRYDLDIGANTPTDYENMVQEIILDAEAEVDIITKNTFHKIHRIEWHDGQGDSTKVLDLYPILKLNSVLVYSPGFQTYNTYEGEFFMVDNEAGSVSFPTILYGQTSIIQHPLAALGYAFLPGKKNVRFDYWAGWDDGVPDAGYYAGIRRGTTLIAASMLLEQAENRLSQGMMSLNVTGQAAQYGRWGLYAQQLRERGTQQVMRFRRQQISGMIL